MKKTLLSLVVIVALLLVIGERAPETTMAEFLVWKAVALVAMYLAGRALVPILEKEDEEERAAKEARRKADAETINE